MRIRSAAAGAQGVITVIGYGRWRRTSTATRRRFFLTSGARSMQCFSRGVWSC